MGKFYTQYGKLPTWHDLYIKGSTDTLDLDYISVQLPQQDPNNALIDTSLNYYKYSDDTTKKYLCVSQASSVTNIIHKNTAIIPGFSIDSSHMSSGGLVFKGCSLNAGIKWDENMTNKKVLDYSGTLTRNRGGKLIYKRKTNGKETTIIEKDAPYLLYFELVGGGGGGASYTYVETLSGCGGGSASAMVGILDFRKQNSFQVEIGAGGLKTSESNPADKKGYNGNDSYIVVGDNVFVAPRGFGGNLRRKYSDSDEIYGSGGNGGSDCYYVYKQSYDNDDLSLSKKLSDYTYYYDGIIILKVIKGTQGGIGGTWENRYRGGDGGSLEGDVDIITYGSLPSYKALPSSRYVGKGGEGYNTTDPIDNNLDGWAGQYGGGGGGGARCGGRGGGGVLRLTW